MRILRETRPFPVIIVGLSVDKVFVSIERPTFEHKPYGSEVGRNALHCYSYSLSLYRSVVAGGIYSVQSRSPDSATLALAFLLAMASEQRGIIAL